MTLRIILLAVLSFLIVRALRMLIGGALREVTGAPGAAAGGRRQPRTAVKLVRDPVCGTHVAPQSALSLVAGGTTQYFCSPECREKFRSRT